MICAPRLVARQYLLVLTGAVIAIVWANIAGSSYFRVAENLAFAVNDVGMAVVLAVLAQEVVEAMHPGGTLYSWRRALLPVAAAIGGVLGAAATYKVYILAGDTRNLLEGWPIVCAVDVAFCAILATSIFGRGAALTFALFVAIASDAIGLALISYRYPVSSAHPTAAALMVPALWSAARIKGRPAPGVYAHAAASVTLSWFAFYWSGIHPALALLPIVPLLPHSPRDVDPLIDVAEGPHQAARHCEYVLRYPVQAVAFLFGLVNGGVLARGFGSGTWSVLMAALVGRPVGILVGTAIGIVAGLKLPSLLRWCDLVVIALCAGPGFTFGLFFSTAVFAVGPLLTEVKIGAMMTVVVALVAFGAARVLRVGRFA